MNVRSPSLPLKLRIWQQNAHKSKTAHSYILNNANPNNWDVIALQEPWFDSYGNSRGTQYWRVIYPANFYMEGRNCVRSILLINTNISTDSYSIIPVMHSDVTAVRFKGDHGFLSLFNIYNEITNNDTINYLDSFLDRHEHLVRHSGADNVVWLGDFNRHHPIWEDDSNERLFEPTEFISPLLDLLYKNEMLLALPKGIPTYQTAAGNWTRPDNVWRSSSPDDPISRCDVVPAMRPPMADHLPIVTELALPLPRAPEAKALDFRQADWPEVNADLTQRLAELSPAVCINSEEEFLQKVDEVVRLTKETLDDHLKERRPSPFKRRWWTQELSTLKKTQNRLSGKSFRFRHVRDHPVHVMYKAATNQFKSIMEETRSQDWTDWLESATQQDLYIANKYVTNEPSDYSSARVPTLKTSVNNVPGMAEDNVAKAKALADSFPPPVLFLGTVRCNIPPPRSKASVASLGQGYAKLSGR